MQVMVRMAQVLARPGPGNQWSVGKQTDPGTPSPAHALSPDSALERTPCRENCMAGPKQSVAGDASDEKSKREAEEARKRKLERSLEQGLEDSRSEEHTSELQSLRQLV